MANIKLTKVNRFLREGDPDCPTGYGGEQYCGLIIENNRRVSVLYAPVAVKYSGNYATILDTRGITDRINIRDTDYTMPTFQALIDEINCCCEEAEAVVLPDIFIGENYSLVTVGVDGTLSSPKAGGASFILTGMPSLDIGNTVVVPQTFAATSGFRANSAFSNIAVKGKISVYEDESYFEDSDTAVVMLLHSPISSITFGTDQDITYEVIAKQVMGLMEIYKLYELNFNVDKTTAIGDLFTVAVFCNGTPTFPNRGKDYSISAQIWGNS